MTQHIRLPREVIVGNTGLCIELTFLYASIMRNAGMEPILFSIPGHIYPGFRLNNQYFAIEATGIGGAGLGQILSSQEALEMGLKQLQQFFQAQQAGDERYIMIDVNSLISQGIVPMELKDDTYMRQKVDEYSALWADGGNMRNPQMTGNMHMATNTQPGGRNSRVDNNDSSSGMSTYSKGVTFLYPSGWSVVTNPNPQMPALAALIVSPQQNQAIEVYSIQGTTDVGTAINYLVQMYQSMGMQITYQASGQRNGFIYIQGNTSSSNGTAGWSGAFRPRNNQVEGVCVPNSLQQVLSTLK